MLTINNFARKPVDHKRELERHMGDMLRPTALRQIDQHIDWRAIQHCSLWSAP